jgi:hypothetical protein
MRFIIHLQTLPHLFNVSIGQSGGNQILSVESQDQCTESARTPPNVSVGAALLHSVSSSFDMVSKVCNYSPVHKCWPKTSWAGNQSYHQKFDPEYNGWSTP